MVALIQEQSSDFLVRFLQSIAEELKAQSGFNLREEVFFPLRYDRDRPKTVQHKYIAQKLMPKDSRLGDGYYWGSISTTSQNVARSIAGQYSQEMKEDGVDLDILLQGKPGQRGTWEIAYDWLWDCKYPRWLNDNYWNHLICKAKTYSDWIQFSEEDNSCTATDSRNSVMSKGPALERLSRENRSKPSTIVKNQHLFMQIDLEYRDRQLLLLNRSEQGKLVISPSSGYGLNTRMNAAPLQLPQKEAFAYTSEQYFKFKKKGIEEFLAIVLPTQLDMQNFLPDPEQELIPELTNHRFELIFSELEKQRDWHIFYQAFQVRSQKSKKQKSRTD
ncbi:hypothetical protein [Roseofilum casamattae]|uniref:Uncharacterized protein n=1 Tax=Roseofilum casamattae BLCC-M143 TaxID=3022442 RepID=A0ABT7BSE5_9CYAN|nr:hypothetical protein [Roseofilum casamattae]MDJ1182116.1 hypothetical protein [Roseofilum casamattae BLCC-M143]